VINPLLWDVWGEDGQNAYTYLSNLIEKEAVKAERNMSINLLKRYLCKYDIPKNKINLFQTI
jgi:hypothetical protein